MIPEIAYNTPVAILSIRLACIVLLTSFFRNRFNHTDERELIEQYQGSDKNIIDRAMTVFPIPWSIEVGVEAGVVSEVGTTARGSDHHLDSQGFPEARAI